MKSKRKNKANENELDKYFTKDEIITLLTNDLSLATEDVSYLDYEKMKELLEKEQITKLIAKDTITNEELHKLGESMVNIY
jgi:hypothetical protein